MVPPMQNSIVSHWVYNLNIAEYTLIQDFRMPADLVEKR